MSTEKHFHKLIEAQNPEAKQRGIQRVLKAMEENPMPMPMPVSAPVKRFSWKRLVAIGAPVLATLCVGAVVLVNLLPKNGERRYRSNEEYTYEGPVAETLKDYSTRMQTNWLYFDWYDQTDFASGFYRLNDTQEIICYQEQLMDLQGYPVTLSVTDDNTTMEVFSVYEDLSKTAVIDNVSVTWKYNTRKSYSTFVYEGYRYYLQVDEAPEGYILDLTEILIPNVEQ